MYGANAQTYVNKNGGTTKIINAKALVINGLLPGTEVRIFSSSENPDVRGDELGGIEESSTSFTYYYNYDAGDITVDIAIIKSNQEAIWYEDILLGEDGYTLLVQQRFDRQYYNS